jgi:hypothetical protein
MNRPSPHLIVVGLLTVVALAGCVMVPTPTASTATSPASSSPPNTIPGGGQGGTLVRPAHAENGTNGFWLVADESVSGIVPGQEVTFSFAGVNNGSAAKVLRDMCRDGNPRVRIEAPNGTVVQLHPPMVQCMAASYFGPFAHGERVERNLTWNGTIYHGDRASKAPSGRYVAVATFVAQRADRTEEIVVRLPINVLSSGARGVQ